MRVVHQISWEIVSPHVITYQYVQLWHFIILLQQHGWYSWLFWSTVKLNFKSLTPMPIWCHTQGKPYQDEYSINQTSLKNGRHASLEITQCHPLQDTFQPIPGLINCAIGDGDCYRKPHRKLVRQSGGWPYPYSGVEASMQRLLCNCPPDFPKLLLPVINHNWTTDTENGLSWSTIVYVGSEWGTGWDRLWCLWLYPLRCMAYLHQYERVSINQNRTFSILQLTSLKYKDKTIVFVVFIL